MKPATALIVGPLMVAAACHHASGARVASARPLFGPVIGEEVIAGRAEDLDATGPIWLLTGERSLVKIDLAAGASVRRELPIPIGDICWGLARLRDGSFWSLHGRRALVQLSEEGGVTRTIPLTDSYFGLFAAGDRLVYQKAEFIAPAQALFAGPPGEVDRVPFGSLQTRPFPLARTSVAALNMLSCGASQARVRPCWFPNEPTVWLADEKGQMRKVGIAGLPTVAPEVLLTSDAPPRPIRDAYIDRAGAIWILSSGAARRTSAPVPGGWQLGRYTAGGTPLQILALTEPVRLILRAEPTRALVITASGMVAEVAP